MTSNQEKTSAACLLCDSNECEPFFEDKFRSYLCCRECSLIFVPSEFHVSPESEKARYEEHNNDPEDAGYRAFLERIAIPVRERFEKGARGLDFGSGPTPLLAKILTDSGFEMKVYDPIYAPDPEMLEKRYDFVVTTEVVEHLKTPLAEFKKLFSLIGHDGMLAVMTRPFDETVDFRGWHYKNDRTHICFFSEATFDWLSGELVESYIRVENDIFVFDRKRN